MSKGDKSRTSRSQVVLDVDDVHILRLLNQIKAFSFWTFKDLRKNLNISATAFKIHIDRLLIKQLIVVKRLDSEQKFLGAYKNKIAMITNSGRTIVETLRN